MKKQEARLLWFTLERWITIINVCLFFLYIDVIFKELARSTEDFNGAMLKAVSVEAGMIALRRKATEVNHEDFVEGINAVKSKKKAKLYYYS